MLLPALINGASFDSHNRRSEDLLGGHLDWVARSTDQVSFLGANIPARLSRRHNGQLFTGVAPPRRRSASSVSGSTLEMPGLARRNAAQSPLIRRKSIISQQKRRVAAERQVVRDQVLLSRDLAAGDGPRTTRRSLVPRSPKGKKPKESKLQKDIDGAKKTLEKDLAAEKKAQDKAAANAQKATTKAQGTQQKDTAKANKNQAGAESKAEANARKAKENLQKEEKNKGKGGKAGKAYAKAEKNEQKAEQAVGKTKAKGADNINKINTKEDKDLAKAGANLDKDNKKAHDDQFGDKGGRLAKSHPSAWQK